METLTQRLTGRGWRMTAQRRVIARVFDAAGAEHIHLTADDVLERAVAVLPEISRATVYNTLGEMVDAGEVLAVNVGDRVTRYDPNVAKTHHHLVCEVCSSIFDVQAEVLPSANTADVAAIAPGFVIESADVIFRGRCACCR
ncbi:transcriptional repressor [Nakamurella antarctica]|uniref:Transcriptional repressor n=1 Tax=Nakamurella antarctica TaxID=1902245 RepID=A0A3G8ZU57_9ACTN|nr:transcriptional repressor [Nakamurella antarctica]AZI57546.1 transcriptional repressor [Nakamurella antarctica]